MRGIDIYEIALRNLKESVPSFKIDYQSNNERGILDGVLTINGRVFSVCVMTSSTVSPSVKILSKLNDVNATDDYPLILIAPRFSSSLKEYCVQSGLNYLDAAGNCSISGSDLFINISGRKDLNINKPTDNINSLSKIKLIFYFLQAKENVAKPFRQIMNDTDVSIGAIQYTIQDLYSNGYIAIYESKRVLLRREELLDRWQMAYNEVYRPKLFIGRMKLFPGTSHDALVKNGLCAGGENAANAIDGYLIPEKYTYYTTKTVSELASERLMIPAADGDIYVYEKFWNEDLDSALAPRIIICADLLNENDSRCSEAAMRIVNYGI